MDLINQINLGNIFLSPIEPINRLIRTQYNIQHYNNKKCNNYKHSYTLKNREVPGNEECFSGGVLVVNTLCRGCFSHATIIGLLYPKGDRSEKIFTSYKV